MFGGEFARILEQNAKVKRCDQYHFAMEERIAELQEEVERLREAIKPIADVWEPGVSSRLARGDMINIVRGVLGMTTLEDAKEQTP